MCRVHTLDHLQRNYYEYSKIYTQYVAALYAADLQTFEGTSATLNLDAEDPFSHKTFRTLIGEGVPFKLFVSKGLPKVIGGKLEDDFIPEKEWTKFSKAQPELSKDILRMMLQFGPVDLYEIAQLGHPGRKIASVDDDSLRVVSVTEAARPKHTIRFPDLLTGAGKPVELNLDAEELFTHKTFRDLIAQKTPYYIALIKNPLRDMYQFFDAAEWDAAIAKKIAFSKGDILRYKIMNLKTPPQKVS